MIAILVLVVLAIVLVAARAQSDKKQNPESPKQPTGEKWMGAFEAYDVAFNIIKKNPTFALATGVAMLVGYALSVIIQGQPKFGEIWFPVGQYVLLLPLALVMPAYSVAVADGKNPSFGSLYRRPVRVFVYLILAYILAELMIGASAILFIVPVIWTLAWFMMTGFVVMDKNMGPIKSLKESKRLAKDHIGKVWGLIGVSVLLSSVSNIVAIAPVAGKYLSAAVIGVATVWASVATAVLYRWLQKNVKKQNDSPKETK